MNEFTTYIAKYKSQGLTVFPCRGSKDPHNPKAPVPNDWFNSSCDIGEFTTDYVGMACRNGMEVLDFDNHLFNATRIFTEFFNGCTFMDKLTINRTGGGGYHVIYYTECVEGNRKLAAQLNTLNNGWEAIIETRGEGGQIVIPPTPNYVTIHGDLCHIQLISVEEREWLMNRAKHFDEKLPKKEKERTFEPQTPSDGTLERFNKSREGYSYMVALLRENGWKLFDTNKLTRPNKKFGISAQILAPHNGFYVYSSNADPFENNTMYSPAQVVNMLEYNGNWNETFKKIKQVLNIG